MAGSVGSNASAKESYQAQFDVHSDFINFGKYKTNNVNVFGSVRTADGEQFLESPKNNWPRQVRI